jgi:ribosomal protein S18 acetylase RimI-like enzyme
MANYPSTFAAEITPLTPDDFSSQYGAGAVSLLAERGFVVMAGVTQYQGDQIARIGVERGVREFCPKDATDSRFGTRAAMAEWLGKGGGRGMTIIASVVDYDKPLSMADIAALRDEDLKVRAYGWSGYELNKHIPGADITTAYRVSETAAGNGLGKLLVRLVTASAVDVFEVKDPATISLETWASNTVAVGLYGKVGYESGEGIKPITDVRPTLEEPGTIINGKKVFLTRKNGELVTMVEDKRLFKRFNPTHLKSAA